MRITRVSAGMIAFGVVLVGIAVPDLLGSRGGTAAAQSGGYYTPPATDEREVTRARRAAGVPTRLEVTPRRPLVRICEDWLDVENRPSGSAIVPKMRCRWGYR
ncbi:hypothetical protein [Rhodoplanes azumiensis]|uniref:Uncharacterized protein n=1 Tax=Rhodoplanes azumiensis TaxID=1897628 RepID=A0ABW5AQI5_9BRAD